MARKADMANRRKVRAVEAKRDTLMERLTKTKVELAQARAALKSIRSGRS